MTKNKCLSRVSHLLPEFYAMCLPVFFRFCLRGIDGGGERRDAYHRRPSCSMRVPSGGRVGSKGRSPKEKWENFGNFCSYLVQNPCFNIILLSLMQRTFKSVVCVQISLWGWREGAKNFFWEGGRRCAPL